MTSRIGLAVAVLVVGLAAFAGWKMLVAPKRVQTAAAAAQIVQAQARVAAAGVAIAKGERARADSRRDTAVLSRLTKAVPVDDDVAPLVRQLDAIARANHIDFRSARLASGGAPPPPPPPAAAAAATEGKDDAAGGKAAAPASDAAAPANGDAAASDDAAASGAAEPVAAPVAQPPPGAVVGAAGLLTVPFSFTFDGGYREMERFLAAVHALARSERGKIKVRGRLITVDGFSLLAGRDGFPTVMAVVSATAYLLPAEPAPAPAVAAVAPVGAAAEAKP